MKSKAIERAKDRLNRASQAVEALDNANGFEQVSAAWYDFLLASDAIYEQLRAGSSRSDRSRGWFNNKAGQRKADPLLNYLHHARNAEYHGIEDVVEKHTQTANVVSSSGVNVLSSKGQNVICNRTVLRLTGVDDRNGNSYPPPSSHNGNPVSDQRPHAIAQLALQYFHQLVAEAKVLSEQGG